MIKERFSYQNLRVYEDMIRAISLGEEIASGWDSVHAIADHFTRASEGALLCLAESSRKRQIPARTEAASHSLGSILECAACFDISTCKSLVSQEKCNEVKKKLSSVFRQLYTLRRSWQAEGEIELRESAVEYGDNHIFHHERLKTYQLVRLLVGIDKMTAKLASVWKKEEEKEQHME